jgi:hypothetical protein
MAINCRTLAFFNHREAITATWPHRDYSLSRAIQFSTTVADVGSRPARPSNRE